MYGYVMALRFEWDEAKNAYNQEKHGVSFQTAEAAFSDPFLVILEDAAHSASEKRYFGYGKVGGSVMTVRFTMRGNVVRIYGAAYWRKGTKIYEQENNL